MAEGSQSTTDPFEAILALDGGFLVQHPYSATSNWLISYPFAIILSKTLAKSNTHCAWLVAYSSTIVAVTDWDFSHLASVAPFNLPSAHLSAFL